MHRKEIRVGVVGGTCKDMSDAELLVEALEDMCAENTDVTLVVPMTSHDLVEFTRSIAEAKGYSVVGFAALDDAYETDWFDGQLVDEIVTVEEPIEKDPTDLVGYIDCLYVLGEDSGGPIIDAAEMEFLPIINIYE